MTNGLGGLAGAAIGVGLLGVGLGVTGNVIKQTQKQLNKPAKKAKKGRLKRAGIY